jgi:hypothetical protein
VSRIAAWFAANWLKLAEWTAYKAWSYAKKRAVGRAMWAPGEAQDARNEQTPDQRRIAANEARQVMDNRHFKTAWESLNAALEAQILGCDTNTDEGQRKAARIVASKQLLHGLRREFMRKLDDGYMAEAELDEIERRNRPVRMVR